MAAAHNAGALTLDAAQRRRLAQAGRVPVRDLAGRFNVSVSTIKRVLADIRREGTAA